MAQRATAESADNIEYVRRLLSRKQPAFAAALDLAAELVDWELSSLADRELPSSVLPTASHAPAAHDQ